MESNDSFSPEKVQASYRELSAAAADLNQMSEQMSKTVSILNDGLQKLNLGISAWVKISGNELPDGTFWRREIGYAKLHGSWGIALRKVRGSRLVPTEEEDDKYTFDEAPRWQRIEGVAKIPDLLEKLTKQANEITKRIAEATFRAKEIAAAINQVTASEPATRK